MNSKSIYYLMISRYVAYLIAYIFSLIVMKGNLNIIIPYSILFVFLLLNSSIRFRFLYEKIVLFNISIVIDLIIIFIMFTVSFDSLSFIFYYIVAVDLYLYLEFKYAIPMTIVLCLSIFTLFSVRLSDSGIWFILSNFASSTAGLLFFAGTGYLVRKELHSREKIQALYNDLKDSNDKLEDANIKLKSYATRIEEISVINERNRLAGEIHDKIGHSLTALIMEIELCEKLIDKNVDQTKIELNQASDLARNALADVRVSVREMKPAGNENITGINAIKQLISEFKKSTGFIVELNVSKQQFKISPTIETTIYSMIQESLTNSAKHSKAGIIIIDITFKDGSVGVCVKDNGLGIAAEEFVKGMGLITMEERIESLGGVINYAFDNGFMIDVTIPVEG